MKVISISLKKQKSPTTVSREELETKEGLNFYFIVLIGLRIFECMAAYTGVIIFRINSLG